MKLIFNYSDISTPVLLETNMNEEVIEGITNTPLELRCLVKGRPKPEITWYKNNKQFNRKNRTKLEDNNQRLIFVKLQKWDSGLYECVASNRGGTVKITARLKVDKLSDNATTGLSNEEIIVIVLFVLVGTVMIFMAVYIGRKIRQERVSSIFVILRLLNFFPTFSHKFSISF